MALQSRSNPMTDVPQLSKLAYTTWLTWNLCLPFGSGWVEFVEHLDWPSMLWSRCAYLHDFIATGDSLSVAVVHCTKQYVVFNIDSMLKLTSKRGGGQLCYTTALWRKISCCVAIQRIATWRFCSFLHGQQVINSQLKSVSGQYGMTRNGI